MKAVNSKILDLIAELQSLTSVSSFSLAGGTNLAMRFDHRISEDIDLFSNELIGQNGMEKIKSELTAHFGKDLRFCEILNSESGDQYCFLRALIRRKNVDIKTEFIQNVLLFTEPELFHQFKVLSVTDIGVLKLLSAASRKANKDIYDLDLITDKISLETLLSLLEQRVNNIRNEEKKCLFDLDEDINLPADISVLLEFDKIDYANLPRRPSHSNDRLLLLPDSKKWSVVKSNWRQKVKEVMRSKGIIPPGAEPIN